MTKNRAMIQTFLISMYWAVAYWPPGCETGWPVHTHSHSHQRSWNCLYMCTGLAVAASTCANGAASVPRVYCLHMRTVDSGGSQRLYIHANGATSTVQVAHPVCTCMLSAAVASTSPEQVHAALFACGSIRACTHKQISQLLPFPAGHQHEKVCDL